MAILDYDLDITDEQRELQQAAHRFAEEVMRPAGRKVDRMAPATLLSEESPYYHVMREARRLGFSRLAGPVEMGGLGAAPLTQFLVLEELAWGNSGLAAAIFLSPWPAEAAIASGNEELIDLVARPYYGDPERLMIGCWAITEPDHGSDQLSITRPEMRPPAKGSIIARRDGDSWLLSGQKSAWVSNGPTATHGVVNVQLDGATSLDRGGVCILPLDLPGVSRGRPLDKHGVRGLPQGELFFDDVRIPRSWMIAQENGYPDHVYATLSLFNPSVSCLCVGLARAAFEAALEYSKSRVQGGKPIFEHQAVRTRLFRMFELVQAARSLSSQVYVHQMTRAARGEPAPLEHSIVAKVFCADAALEVATLATQLHGGNGMTREYPVEMYLRDAAAYTIADGENAFLGQLAAAAL